MDALTLSCPMRPSGPQGVNEPGRVLTLGLACVEGVGEALGQAAHRVPSTPNQKLNRPSSAISKGPTIHDFATPPTATSAPPNMNSGAGSRTPEMSTMLPRSRTP